jgi:hypothetical protein
VKETGHIFVRLRTVGHAAIGVDAVLHCEQLPTGASNLAASLADVN